MSDSRKDSHLKIRVVCTKDYDRIATLARQLGYPCTIDDIAARLSALSVQHLILVALDNEEVVMGFIHCCLADYLVEDKAVEVRALVVDEQHRGKGAGRDLMHQAELWAKQRNCSAVYLYSNVNRTEAHDFYKHLGYAIVKSEHVLEKSI